MVAAAIASLTITRDEFEKFRVLIGDVAGIALGPAKVQLVASRLARRVRAHGFTSYAQYFEFLQKADADGQELEEMINSITTNKTSFFREPHHFEFLASSVVQQVEARTRGPHTLTVWSAGCSTGEEPYSIAMTLDGWKRRCGADVRILASDIDTTVLQRATEGRYPVEALADMPDEQRRRFFLRGTGPCEGLVRVRSELKQPIAFRRTNLTEDSWSMRERFDAIFCRNVLIYFDRPTQERVVSQLASRLRPGGVLFLGHSESLCGVGGTLERVGHTIYRMPDSNGSAAGDERAPDTASVGIGDVRTGGDGICLTSVLGSCVSACLFDPVARVGGMNHFLLPRGVDEHAPTRFGEQAMGRLLQDLDCRGAVRRRLRAKAFGGAEAPWQTEEDAASRRNVEFVKTFLDRERIPLVASRFGGGRPTEVRFYPAGGRALVRPLPAARFGPGMDARRGRQAWGA